MQEIVAVEQDLFVVNVDYRGLDAVADEMLGSRSPFYEYQFLPWACEVGSTGMPNKIQLLVDLLFSFISFFFFLIQLT